MVRMRSRVQAPIVAPNDIHKPLYIVVFFICYAIISIMRITVCGSMMFEKEMKDAAAQLEGLDYDTETPNSVEGHAYGEGQDLDTIVRIKTRLYPRAFC